MEVMNKQEVSDALPASISAPVDKYREVEAPGCKFGAVFDDEVGKARKKVGDRQMQAYYLQRYRGRR